MASALYDPTYGFYTKGPSIGSREGDFNTNAMFPAFAYAITQAIRVAENNVGEPLRVVELGGGTGELASNIISFYSSSPQYIIIETSPSLRDQQKRRGLTVFSSTESIDAAPTFVFGNEVLDALPVHRVMNDGMGRLMELYVDLDQNQEFVEVPGELSTPDLAKHLKDEHIALGRGQVAEICLDFSPFLQNIKKIISKGYVIFIDYGDEAKDLYAYTKRNGTLRAFRSQRQTFDPFNNIGEQDLTTDVDFTALTRAAQDVGFIPIGKLRQGVWLKSLGIEQYADHRTMPKDALHEIDFLTNMASLGSSFDVLLFKTQGLPDGFSLH